MNALKRHISAQAPFSIVGTDITQDRYQRIINNTASHFMRYENASNKTVLGTQLELNRQKRSAANIQRAAARYSASSMLPLMRRELDRLRQMRKKGDKTKAILQQRTIASAIQVARRPIASFSEALDILFDNQIQKMKGTLQYHGSKNTPSILA